MSDLKRLLPFLNNKDLIDLMDKILISDDLTYQDIRLRNVLPFLDEENLDQTFINLLKGGRTITEFLPFVSQQTLKNLIELHCYNKLNYELNINLIIPYLDGDSMSFLCKKMTE